MMSTQAFFCRLCKVFSGDASCAEHHLKSEEHYKTYQVQETNNEDVTVNNLLSKLYNSGYLCKKEFF